MGIVECLGNRKRGKKVVNGNISIVIKLLFVGYWKYNLSLIVDWDKKNKVIDIMELWYYKHIIIFIYEFGLFDVNSI